MKPYHYMMLAPLIFSIILIFYRYVHRDYGNMSWHFVTAAFCIAMLVFIIHSDHRSEDRAIIFKKEIEELKNSYKTKKEIKD